jgi:hypothetical protein
MLVEGDNAPVCSYCIITQPEPATGEGQGHSPLPWRSKTTDTRFEITDADGFPVLRINGGMIPVKQDVAFIITAVNHHAQLVGVLEDELTALRIWQHAAHPRSDLQEGFAISVSKIETLLTTIRQA